MSDAETELAAALAALASDDDEQALEHLVTAWDACRAAPLIALVDALATRIEPRYKALAGKTANDRYEAFRRSAERGRQGELASLVAVLPRLAYGDVGAALDMLLYSWRPTPRLRALLDQIQLPGYGDRVDELRRVHATPRDEPPTDRARALLAELERALRTDEAGAALLAQVYADPDADAPRIVYADWATSHGDPRGEFITLQYARRERSADAAAVRRERELLERYVRRWLAPLWHAVRPYSIRFERGFLATATVEPFAVIAPRPEWATVVALELAYHEALPIDAFPALRELRNVTPRLLAQIVTAPRRLVHLGLADDPAPRDDLRRAQRAGPEPLRAIPELTSAEAFPALRSLGVWARPEDWAWLWETPLGARLERLEIAGGSGVHADWLAAKLPDHVRELCIRDRRNELTFTREGDAWPILRVVCREAARDVITWSPYAVQLAPPRTLREVRFVLPHRAKSDTIERLERSARRQHALERFTVDVDPFL